MERVRRAKKKTERKTAKKAASSRKNGKKGGRPSTVNIIWSEFEKLCTFQCTREEIASWFDCSIDRLDILIKKHYGVGFKVIFKEKAAKGLISLRRAQFRKAVTAQSNTMLIWLGKQYLDQTDKSSDTLHVRGGVEKTVTHRLRVDGLKKLSVEHLEGLVEILSELEEGAKTSEKLEAAVRDKEAGTVH